MNNCAQGGRFTIYLFSQAFFEHNLYLPNPRMKDKMASRKAQRKSEGGGIKQQQQ